MATEARSSRQVGGRPLLSVFAVIVGLVFLLLGILGFIPGITTDFGEMQLAGQDSQAMLFGIFQVSVLHNIVHLLAGVLGLALARSPISALLYLIIGGLVFVALWIYGLVVDQDSTANFIPVDDAVSWLHFGLGVGMIALGLIGWALDRRIRG